MKIKKCIPLIFGSLLALPLWGAAPEAWAAALKVITTTPDLASIAGEIGGDKITVESLAKPSQNPHFVDAKPSLIVKLMKADLFLETGMELEVGWAPNLIQSSGNRNIQRGAKGYLDCSKNIAALEVPQSLNRAMGDVHAQGNPHYLADPENAKLVAGAIADKMSELSPENSAYFKERRKAFEAELDRRLAEWKKALAPYSGARFASYHKVYPYFAQRFGLVSIGEIEPKPGIPPTAGHTSELIDRMKTEKVKIILTDPWYENRSAMVIAKEAGASVIEMALQPGAKPETDTYLKAMDYNVRSIAQALGAAK